MRKFLLIVLLLIVALSILWIFAGRQISEFVDQFKTEWTPSSTVRAVSYKGTGDGGQLEIAVPPARFFGELVPLNPHIGTDKENQLALAYAGKVFAFGPLRSAEDQVLAAEVPNGETASINYGHSLLPWLDLTWLKAHHLLALRNHSYFRLVWTKANGATIKMLWRSSGDGDPTVWPTNGFDDSSLMMPDLIRVEISEPSR